MFSKKPKDQTLRSVRDPAVRKRRTVSATSESFRRNAVVFSKAQKEVDRAHQSVTQRQLDNKRRLARRKRHMQFIGVSLVALVGVLLVRMNVQSVRLESNASSRLAAADRVLYETEIMSYYKAHTTFGQWWLVDKPALTQSIKERFPEVEQITFVSNAPFATHSKAEVRFRKAVFTWRDASNQQQFVDKNGVLFTKNLDPAVTTSKLITIEDQSGVVSDAGNAVITESVIGFIGQLHTKLPPLYGENSAVSQVVIPKATREVQVKMSGQNYYIKLSSARDLDQQIGELGALIQYLRAKNIVPAEYIDVRVPHKAFYK